MGFVYIFTNPCLDGWVKIGKTDNIANRLEELNRPSNIPYSFRAYATYEVETPEEVEKGIHKLIDTIDEDLRARERRKKGGERVREFFSIPPEKAYAVFEAVSQLRGDTDKLERIFPTPEQAEEEFVEETIRTRRANFSFRALGIQIGEELVYAYDDTKKCKVIDEHNGVEYEGERYTLSRLSKELSGGWATHGPRFFRYEDEFLTDRRDRMEREMDE